MDIKASNNTAATKITLAIRKSVMNCPKEERKAIPFRLEMLRRDALRKALNKNSEQYWTDVYGFLCGYQTAVNDLMNSDVCVYL